MSASEGAFGGFSSTYKCHRLVWFERFEFIGNAIAREKQLKRWRREKKVTLIEKMNPSWTDLSEVWRSMEKMQIRPLRCAPVGMTNGEDRQNAGPSLRSG